MMLKNKEEKQNQNQKILKFLFNENYEEVLLWYNYFICNSPADSDSKITFYSVKNFLTMLFIVTHNNKQFCRKPFKNIMCGREHECFRHFKCYFGSQYYVSNISILKEWIKRYTSPDASESESSKDLPFTEELIFVLFNFFAVHGKCLKK